tara:strand:- start:363 stop:1478 length:1116 start_codon:yes stop_codon:yes gene_type:complete
MQHKTPTRSGPRPLWLHLNATVAMMASLSDTKEMFTASSNILCEALHGVEQYHNSPVKPFHRPMTVVAKHNGTSLLTAQEWQDDTVVVLIPSLINRWGIFDIEADHSFAASLCMSGLSPVIVDWAEPDAKNISLNDYITDHLKPLIMQLIESGKTVQGLIGYCMGGTIIAALLSAYPELKDKTGSHILIAPPWDFSYQTPDQKMRLQGMGMQTYAMASPVPTDFVQSLFWAIDPLQVIKKFRRFPDIANPERFVRVEDWLNEGRQVSLSVIQTCLFDWYRDNEIMDGRWCVNNVPVKADSLGKDVLIAGGLRDNLVPSASFKPLLNNLKNAQYVTVDTGHIGLMASDKSRKALWKPIADFLKKSNVVKNNK